MIVSKLFEIGKKGVGGRSSHLAEVIEQESE